jgi:hypothetical protein
MNKCFVRWVLLAAVVVLALGGCSLVGISVEDRVAQFLEDLNSPDRSQIYLNFHPTLTADYGALQGGTLVAWDTVFPISGYVPYSIPDLDPSDPESVTGNISSANDAAWVGPKAIEFRMAQDGADWMIEELDLDLANLVQ